MVLLNEGQSDRCQSRPRIPKCKDSSRRSPLTRGRWVLSTHISSCHLSQTAVFPAEGLVRRSTSSYSAPRWSSRNRRISFVSAFLSGSTTILGAKMGGTELPTLPPHHWQLSSTCS
ncbi:hypothetical protein O181_015913 [Austropuccinia psidii MF-1]|uniref:Uncharacterized protein n=1 Tax=Austropuccinia psidii MF-1 TaxID=1389203 RepID=A0A9Q3GQD8_9BASI|nr:hypothetical protein [Austropuccinia psidii MF-1]